MVEYASVIPTGNAALALSTCRRKALRYMEIAGARYGEPAAIRTGQPAAPISMDRPNAERIASGGAVGRRRSSPARSYRKPDMQDRRESVDRRIGSGTR